MTEWLRNKIFHDAVRAKSFGPDVTKFVKFKPDPHKAVDHFSSDIVFGDVTLETKTGRKVEESVIVKVQTFKDNTDSLTDFNYHFHNELIFYTEVIPLFRKYDTDNFLSENVPEFIYGIVNADNPKEDVIILRNLNKKGFRMTRDRLFLDEKHINLALSNIAKYHVLSYQCQHEDPEGFKKVVAKIQVGFLKNPGGTVDGKLFWDILSCRGIDSLKTDQTYKDRLDDLSKHGENSVFWMNKYLGPSEQTNVLIHGDFTRNNLLYKYDTDGEPEEVIILDWGCLKYCSPMVDVGLFLMVNTSPQVKQFHWDDFLRTYHSALSRKLAGHPAIPSFSDIEEEMRKKGVYGYHWSALFLPEAYGTPDKEVYKSMGPLSKIRYLLECGKEEVRGYLSENVKHMLDRNFAFDH